MTIKNLEKVLTPQSIAVIGANNRKNSVGYIVFHNLIGSGYDGVVYPVNPKHKSIQGVYAFKSVLELPDRTDCAIIATPAATVPGIVEQCGQAGIRGIIIISAGFAEMGEAGTEALRRIDMYKNRYDLRIMGPNCLGFITPRLNLNASFALSQVKPGKTAFISQSGALGTAILDRAFSQNIGFSSFVSLGSMLDVDFGDLIDFFGADRNTENIIMYIESITNARSFMSACRGFTLNKPVILVKAGRVPEGAQAAASHTGAIAGADEIYAAAFRRTGVVRVDEVVELFQTSETLALQPIPRGDTMMIITNAGGPGVMATDAIIRSHGRVASLDPDTVEKLNAVLPPYWSHGNPVDILGDADEQRYAHALDICMNQNNVDGVLVILTPQAMTKPTETAALIVQRAKQYHKPVLTSWMGAGAVEEGRKVLRNGGIPNFETPEEAIRAFLYMYQYKKNIEILYETPESVNHAPQPPLHQIHQMISEIYHSGRTLLSETESKQILEYYGIETTKPYVAHTKEEAAQAAERIGYPVVMKIQSKDITHKSDAGCVVLNINEYAQALDTFGTIIDNAHKYNPEADIEGVTVQRMVHGQHYELILGSKRDPVFGSVILFGAGGVAVELTRDTTIGFPPLNQTLARHLMEGTHMFSLLHRGHRTLPPANIRFLERILVHFSQLIIDIPEIQEIDINPLVASADYCIALDARMIIDPRWVDVKTESYDHVSLSPYPRQFTKKIDIENTQITLRPLRPEDEPKWLEMFNSFSEETRRFRFFRIIKDMPHYERIRYVFSDYNREIAIVPVTGQAENEVILGVGRMSGVASDGTAEFAIALRDEWQSRGLGEQLFDFLIEICRKKGWKRITATALANNTKMIHLFRKKGCRLKYDSIEKVYHVSYTIHNHE